MDSISKKKKTVLGLFDFPLLFPVILLLFFFIIVFSSPAAVNADINKDLQECGQAVTGLATCLAYVTDMSKNPTPDCCSGLKELLKKDKKCLCVIIEDRNDPQLGLKINLTKALSLPSICNAPANISQCPELLGLDPKSKEAQVFYEFGKNSGGSVSAPAVAPAGHVTAPPVPNIAGNATKGKGKDGNSVERNGGRLEVLFGGILLLFVIFIT